MKRLIRKGMALWLALALAASMLPAGFAAGEGSSSSDAGSAQSAEKADDTNLPYEYELDEDGNASRRLKRRKRPEKRTVLLHPPSLKR